MFALPWIAQIHTDRYADEPHTSITVGNINTADDALTAVQAITALLDYPDHPAARQWLIERFGEAWLEPLVDLANELPPAFWVDMLDPTGHRCHTGLSAAAAISDRENLQVIQIGG
jgi:hypothetical protein